jgi:sulfite reductase (NADPH) flavoprotein alpha-component
LGGAVLGQQLNASRDSRAIGRIGADVRLRGFSRDQEHKIYVQHRLLENAAELWAWLEDGAHLYVCGDAERMARDVDRGLAYIVAKESRMEPAAAKAYLARLSREGRYQRDVY